MTEVLLFAVGIIAGAMNSIAGGGMLLGFPVLLATGMPALAANATSGLIVLPGQFSSAVGYRKYLKQIPPQYLLLAIPCMIGGGIGATFLRHTSPAKFAHIIPILILFAVVLFVFQPFLHQQVHRHLHGSKKHRQKMQPLLLVCLAMLPLSIYGGYFGAGFGFIMLAFLGFTKLHEIHQIQALKNVMAVFIAIATISCLFSAQLIDWKHGSFMAAGNLIGGYTGARAAQRIPSHAIRILVIIIGLCTAGYLLFRSY